MKNFETNLKQLEKIIENLSSGEKNLSSAIDLYKKGLELIKIMHAQLQTTEKEVKILLEKNGKIAEENFIKE